MNELIDEYVNEIKNTDNFKRLLELKEIIDNKYKSEILAFKTAEEKYLEASKYPNYYDMNAIKNNLIETKKNLYSKSEVKEYFTLENSIQNKLNEDFDKIKNSIHNEEKTRCVKLK